MKNKFLTKNTKVILKEEQTPNGLRTYEKIHKEDATINNDALKEIGKKLEDYYGDELKELDPIPKVTGDDEIGSDNVDIYNIEALGSGKMSALEYEAEGSEVFKKFMKRIDDLNDTSEYDKEFGTKDGFGETDKPTNTYKKLKDAAAEYNKYEDEYELPNPLRVTQAKKLKEDTKNTKMKRLNFKNEFTSIEEVKELIPENYKIDENVFLMSDGNQTYKLRWDDTIKEATVLNFKNKTAINESVKKMKDLYDFQYGDVNTKTNDYTEETKVFKNLMESVRNKDLLKD